MESDSPPRYQSFKRVGPAGLRAALIKQCNEVRFFGRAPDYGGFADGEADRLQPGFLGFESSVPCQKFAAVVERIRLSPSKRVHAGSSPAGRASFRERILR